MTAQAPHTPQLGSHQMPRLLKRQDVCQLCAISQSNFYEWVKQLPADCVVYIGTSLRVREDKLREHMDSGLFKVPQTGRKRS